LLWEGRRLPGPWLVVRALEAASARAKTFGTGTVIIRRSHHIACLGAYLRPVAEQGLVAVLMSSDPSVRGVAPHGGTTPLYTPNPVAAAYPTKDEPIIMDVSTSATTIGLSARQHAAGANMPHRWMKSAEGGITDDPGVLFTDPPGSILPLGGADSGHKGYALGLLVEAMTSSMAGFGRSDQPTGWGASVYVHVMDPEAFGGLDAFTRDTQWMVGACRGSGVADGDPAVRVPGERGLGARREALETGVDLHEGILESLAPWADKFGVEPLTQ
jgi:L-lactate dehydrogenase